jgi:hypothetical protein
VKVLDRIRGNKVVRAASFALTMVIALLAASIVVSITIDLGPYARRYAEARASKYLDRPVSHRRSANPSLHRSVPRRRHHIDGLHPGDRPFFTAKRIAVSLDWVPAFRVRPEFLVSAVEITDWRMLVERWDGGQSFPRIVRGTPSNGPRRATVTVRWLRASRGEFVYEDHATPWNVICRNLDVTIGNLRNITAPRPSLAAPSASSSTCRCGPT